MSKRNRKPYRPAVGGGGLARPQTPNGQAGTNKSVLINKIDDLASAAADNANEDDLLALEVDEAATPTPDHDLQRAWRKAEEASRLFSYQQARTVEAELKAQEATNGAQAEREQLQIERGELSREREELQRQEAAIRARERDLTERQTLILQREVEAETGFATKNQELLGLVEQQAAALRGERQHLLEELTGKHREVEQRAATELEERIADLERERGLIREEQRKLVRERNQIAVDREILEDDRRQLEEHIAQRAAHTVQGLELERQALTRRLEATRTSEDQLQARLLELERARERFGDMSPDEILKSLEQLRMQKADLERKLDERPSQQAMERLRVLEMEHEGWEQDRSQLAVEAQQLRLQLRRNQIAIGEVETLRNQKESLEARARLLGEVIEGLQHDIDKWTSRTDSKRPFPSCSAMDEDADLQASQATVDEIPDLKTFALDLRQRIALNREGSGPLFYSDADLRALLGGLAMSRLHILQGISGTGKTSLPRAFARAVGAGHKVIEVQAGWRDRQDLIGHFNTFEGRFHETEFLQSLYQAQCPSFLNRPYIIVLDEMNLSRPEQYFADLLSALEQEESDRELTLMTAAVNMGPLLLREGRKLTIPRNVWFIGTANHDETTVEFADKTYDRAHIMELPRAPAQFVPRPADARNPIAFWALERAFDNAVDRYASEASRAFYFLTERFAEHLDEHFKVGWGNRLERQMKRFVPAVIASGGSIGEATDHILATKILRKIRDRYDTRKVHLNDLGDSVRMHWPSLDPTSQPRQSLELIKRELDRKGSDDQLSRG